MGLSFVNFISAAFTPMNLSTEAGPSLKVSWIFQNNNIHLLLEKNRAGHASFGLGSSMSSGDIVVVETANNAITVKDCKLIGQTMPSCTETQDWSVVDQQISSTGFKVEISRPMKSSDSNDMEYRASKMSVIYAYNDQPSLSYHNGAGAAYRSFELDFASGAANKEQPRLGDGTWMTHQHTQILLWVIIADILIPVGRYLRRYTRFFDGHSMPLLCVLILSIIFRGPVGGAGKGVHSGFSIALIVLSAMIAVNGILIRGIIEFDKIPLSVHRITWSRRIHLILGIATWIVARVCIFTGCVMHTRLYGPLLLNLVIAETVLFFVCILAFEFIRWRSFNYKPNAQRSEMKPSDDVKSLQILDDIRKGLTIRELKKKYPKQNVLIHQNKVYDMGWYIHPGGQYFFDVCRWREVSRFIQGAVGLESMNNAAWTHSEAAIHALESHYIGDLLTPGPDGTDIVLRDTQGHVVISTVKDHWYLDSRKTISPTTAILHFKCKTMMVKLNCRGLHWLGRHYTISDGTKSRPYTNCTSLASESVAYRKAMVEYFELAKMGEGKKPAQMPILQEHIDYLPVCVKQYEGETALSKKLVSGDKGLLYTLEGPIGRSIEIPENFSGNVVLIAGGTGILPFLDLLEFLLKKAIYSVCKRDKIDPSFVKPEQDYDSYFPGASFNLLAAFRTIDDFTGVECVSDLYGISKKHNLNLFDSLIRVKGLAIEHGLPTTEAHFTTDWLKNYVNKKDDELILICGPPQMQATLYKSLHKELKISHDKIVFV